VRLIYDEHTTRAGGLNDYGFRDGRPPRSATMKLGAERLAANGVKDDRSNSMPQGGIEAPVCRECGHPIDFHAKGCSRDVPKRGLDSCVSSETGVKQ
jgi:hypothetical protein